MNERITLGAAALTGGLSLLTLVARRWPVPTGRHRRTPERPPFAIVDQAFRFCLVCGVETAATVHADGSFHCTEGHFDTPGGGGR